MAKSVGGNGFRALSRLAAQADLKRSDLLALNANLGEESIRLVRLGFRSESEPNGTPWKPLKYRRGRILQDTGRLKAGWKRSRTSPDFVTISPSVNYAVYHQYGTDGRRSSSTRTQRVGSGGRFVSRKRRSPRRSRGAVMLYEGVRSLTFKAGSGKIPARPMVPDGALPDRWRKPLIRVAKAFLKAKIGK